jgi:hypothetical protein
MITIKWKSGFGGRFQSGYVGDKHVFTVDNILLYDNRSTDKKGRHNTYPVTGQKHGKAIAKDLINGLNLDIHENSRLEQAKKDKKEGDEFCDLMKRSNKLIKQAESDGKNIHKG